jgi:hypothetical protein
VFAFGVQIFALSYKMSTLFIFFIYFILSLLRDYLVFQYLYLFPVIDCNQTAIDLPPVTFSVFLILCNFGKTCASGRNSRDASAIKRGKSVSGMYV